MRARAHWHNPIYKGEIDYDRYPHLVVSGITALAIGLAAMGTAAGIGTAMVAADSATKERKQQQSILDQQNARADAAAAKIANADATATQAAADKLLQKKRSLTQTILTSPLGVTDSSTTGARPSLLGGK